MRRLVEAADRILSVMPGLVPGIHVFRPAKQDVDGRDIGERSDAVLWTAMPGHDNDAIQRVSKFL